MLTVETEANGAQGLHMNGVHPWLVLLASRAGSKEFGPASGCSRPPRRKYFFLTIHYFTSFVQISQQAWQAVVPGRSSLNAVSGVTL